MILSHLPLLFLVLDFLGVFAGALGGAIGAIRDPQHKYDVVGVIGLSFAAALGGGITRDVILQRGPPLAFLDIRYEIIAFGAALIALAFRSKLGTRADRAIVVIDALAIGLFSVAGTTRALNAGLNRLPALLLGAVTAVGGGVWRDVLSGRTPKIFVGGHLYAIAALAGSAVFLLGEAMDVSRPLSSTMGTAACFALRLLSVSRDWKTRAVGQPM